MNQNALEKRGEGVVVGPLAGRPGRGVEVGELRVRQRVAMADDLVDHVRLRRVQRHGWMAHVLRRQEAPVAERAVELADRGQPGSGLDAPTGELLQPPRHVGELRHAVGRQGEPCDPVEERRAGVLAVQFTERLLGGRPGLVLGRGVVDVRASSPGRQTDRRAGDLVATAEVLGIGHSRMVVGEFDRAAPVSYVVMTKSCRAATDCATICPEVRTIDR